MKAHKPAAGFTLIELLVVIAIIGILAALLFPVFSSVRIKGKEAKCTSQLHEISIAMGAYLAEKHSYPRPPRYDGNRYQGGVSGLYPDYIQDKSIFICPEDTYASKHWDDARTKVYSSYNGEILGDTATGSQDPWDFKLDGNSVPYRFYNYFGYNNDGYDLFTAVGGANPFVSPVNSPLPTWLSDDGLSWRFYPRLMNRYAPGNTIITHCIFHRARYGTQFAKQKDIVVRMNGRTDKVDLGPMSTPGTNGVSPWVTQK